MDAAGSDLDKVDAFLAADLIPSPEAIGASIKSADAVNGTIAGIDTELLAVAMARDEGGTIGDRLDELLDTDELRRGAGTTAGVSWPTSPLHRLRRSPPVVGATRPCSHLPVDDPLPPIRRRTGDRS